MNKQIKEFKEKSFNSIKLAQEYALDQDLTILDINTERGSFGNFNIDSNFKQFENFSRSSNNQNNQLGNTISIEVARVEAANDIKRIDLQIKKIKELDSKSENLQFISIIVPAVVNEGLPQDLRELDLKIIELSSKYTENFIPLINLKNQRIILINTLKERAIGFLEAEKLLAQARMESAQRPKGVLLEYKELIREAKRDETTLIQLENLLRSIELEGSKIEDPWELITTPTLYPNAVAPSKRLIVFLALLSSGLLGIITTLILEKKRNLIYFSDDYDSIANCSFISEFDSLEKSYLENSLQLIADGQLSKKDDEIAFLGIGNIDVSIIDQLSKSAKIIFPSKKILLTTNFFEANKFKNIIGIIKIGMSRKKDLSKTLENLNLQKRNLLGLIIINNTNS